MTDDQWKPVAEASREALELLGYGLPRCLPGEPDACGGSYSEHAAAHLATLKAVADHQLAHQGQQGTLVSEVYARVSVELEVDCGQGHPRRPS